MNQPVQSRFFQSRGIEELLAFAGFQLRNLRFHRSADAHHFTTLILRALLDDPGVFVAVGDARLVHVRHIQLRLHRNQEQITREDLLIVRQLNRSRRLACTQHRQQLLYSAQLALLRRRRGVALRSLLGFGQPLLHGLQIGQQQLRVDDLHIVLRIHAARDVDHLRIGKAANDVQNRVRLPNMREELIAQALALARAFHDACDVHKLHRRRHNRVRLHHRYDAVHAVVRNRHNPHIWIDGAKRVVRGLGLGGCERVEDGGFADVRQPDNSAVQRHGSKGSFTSSIGTCSRFRRT